MRRCGAIREHDCSCDRAADWEREWFHLHFNPALEREGFKGSEEVGGGMHRSKHPYDGKDRKSQGNLDDAVAREFTKRC
jgi:hypothetical protein